MKLLMMEGNTPALQHRARKRNVRTASEIYTQVIRRFMPEADIDVVNGTEGEFLPPGKSYDDYAGLVISGSSLHAYDETPEVQLQVEALHRFAETGKPVLGSCWGLQVATVAAGGKVGLSRHGRELGIARKIRRMDTANPHPFLKGKPAVYDAPCIHYDEVVQLPDNATLLSGNSHSPIQSAIIPVGTSEVWGVQYHPEFDIAQLRMLFELYEKDMVEQGFADDESDYTEHLKKYRRIEKDPHNKAVSWQLGIDADVLDETVRAAEIVNWLHYCQSEHQAR